MSKETLRPITPEEAYDQLHNALAALKKRHGTDFFTGPNEAEKVIQAARDQLAKLQLVLVVLMDD